MSTITRPNRTELSLLIQPWFLHSAKVNINMGRFRLFLLLNWTAQCCAFVQLACICKIFQLCRRQTEVVISLFAAEFPCSSRSLCRCEWWFVCGLEKERKRKVELALLCLDGGGKKGSEEDFFATPPEYVHTASLLPRISFSHWIYFKGCMD